MAAAHLPLPRELDFSFFSPPPNFNALTDLLPQQLFSHSLSSSHRCRRRIEGRTVGFHSRRAGSLLRERFEAACSYPRLTAEGQRGSSFALSLSRFLTRSLAFTALDLVPVTRARARERERKRKNSHARIVHPPSPTRNDNTALLCVFFYYRLALYLRKSVFVTSTNTVQPFLFDIRAFLASLSHRTLSFYFPLLFLSLSFYREPVREFLSLSLSFTVAFSFAEYVRLFCLSRRVYFFPRHFPAFTFLLSENRLSRSTR